jgi:hypothetical protein
MSDPKVLVMIEVTLIAKDGFYSVSKFSPELWEQQREVALELAHKEHVAMREITPNPFPRES